MITVSPDVSHQVRDSIPLRLEQTGRASEQGSCRAGPPAEQMNITRYLEAIFNTLLKMYIIAAY